MDRYGEDVDTMGAHDDEADYTEDLHHALDADDEDDTTPGFEEDIDAFDSDDDDSDDDDDDYDDELLDATVDEIDCVVALYREDGEPVAVPMSLELANDLDELITQLRRLPGDAGALGLVSISGEFFVLVRVRGRMVQVLLSDGVAANDWPIARDVVEYLGVDLPDEDDDPELVGDGDIVADLGISEFEFEQMADDLDEGSDEQVARIAEQLKFGPQFARAAASQNL